MPLTRASKPALPSPGTSRRRTSDVRNALTAAAEVVLERDGVTGLTVRAVARQARVSPQGIYNHFTEKEGLLLAVLARAFDQLSTAIRSRDQDTSPHVLRAGAEAYRCRALERPVTYRLMFGAPSSPGHLEMLGTHSDAALAALIDAVQAAQQAGEMRTGDPTVMASAIWSSLHGAVALELAHSLPVASMATPIFQAVLDILDRGLAPT